MIIEWFSDPKSWIVVAFAILVFFLHKKAWPALLKFLDSRSAQIAVELENARRLREEAENVLAMYKKKQAEYTKEAESILRKARGDADLLAAHADRELKAAIDIRLQTALDRIAQEESRAISDVRSHIVDISLAAARAAIMQNIEKASPHDLLALALADIDRKIH